LLTSALFRRLTGRQLRQSTRRDPFDCVDDPADVGPVSADPQHRRTTGLVFSVVERSERNKALSSSKRSEPR
jgi:hypothetical protein